MHAGVQKCTAGLTRQGPDDMLQNKRGVKSVNGSCFQGNFKFMLRQLGATVNDIFDEYEKFESGSGEKHRFTFHKDSRLPGRTALYNYARGKTVASGEYLDAIVRFYNSNLGQNVSKEDFVYKNLDVAYSAEELLFLEGEYYCLFLGPAAKAGDPQKRLCGGRLCIKNNSCGDRTTNPPLFAAQLIADMSDEERLLDPSLGEIFNMTDAVRVFEEYRETLNKQSQHHLAYFNGNVSLETNGDNSLECAIVTISLSNASPKTWCIKMDISKILKYFRQHRIRKDKFQYIGGVGAAFVSGDITYGSYLMPIGIVSVPDFAGKVSLQNQVFAELLELQDTSGFFSITQADHAWYEYLLKKLMIS